jgi:2-polyprenyl-3-methyl-5-hydroxy-6-metoxy-1,4-benzoquinol methylase
MGKDPAFAFGRNWQDFLRTFDDERVRIAEVSLTEFLGTTDLQGKSFLDIGCGSGLFSSAAFALRADRIVSFDVDPQSVACCRSLREKAGSPANWTVLEGSVLDGDFMAGLGTFDVVYSWGVLHHTGSMWQAVERAAALVKPQGYYYIALYSKILGRNGSASWIHGFWLGVKRFYNAHPLVAKSVMLPLAMSAYLAMVAAKGENPMRHVRRYKSHRGMSWKTDAIDWLGGYPYEFATVEEVFRFVKNTFPEFNLVNLKVTGGRGLNWYLFRRESSENHSSL